jgi:glutamate synthase (ferredoxin)
MTGGTVLILGETGKNFAAGMSGGTAFVLDEHHQLYRRINEPSLLLREVNDRYDIKQLKSLLEDYVKETGSPKAKRILSDLETWLPSFKKIIPEPYRKMLERISHYEEQGMSEEAAKLEAFMDQRRNGGA